MSKLKENAPKQFKKYYEPFIGGAAFVLDMLPIPAHISDVNAELIELYQVVRDSPKEFLKLISGWKNDEETFYQIRSWDRNKESYMNLTSVERAARFMYLNKTCFNGLYRVGPNGFNAPWGKGSSVAIDHDNILDVSSYLKKIEICCHDFSELTSLMQEGDFVYCDPPYVPLDPDDKWFSGYGVQFGQAEQMRLRDTCLTLREMGTRGVLSNSDTPLVRKLYEGFDMKTISAPRSISRDGGGRKSVSEILVTW